MAITQQVMSFLWWFWSLVQLLELQQLPCGFGPWLRREICLQVEFKQVKHLKSQHSFTSFCRKSDKSSTAAAPDFYHIFCSTEVKQTSTMHKEEKEATTSAETAEYENITFTFQHEDEHQPRCLHEENSSFA